VRLQEKSALVTGAGMGIGRGIALLFAREGANIVAADYDRENGLETVRLIQQTGCQATFVQADVSRPDEVQRMVQAAIDAYGRLDILVNNAGIDLPQATHVLATEIEDWEKIVDVNLKGVFLCSRSAIPAMKRQGHGVIVNIASVAGHRPMPAEAAYGASKAGLILLTKQMARDFAGDGIRVNSVSPGPMEKPTRHRLESLERDQQAYQRRQLFADQIPLRRMCVPGDIAHAALFLASDEASMITGIDLVVDGGFLLT
jgi:NAD(P)-dependent dehydrogenase (short-subunit alcohol dehydrogenase family)